MFPLWCSRSLKEVIDNGGLKLRCFWGAKICRVYIEYVASFQWDKDYEILTISLIPT